MAQHLPAASTIVRAVLKMQYGNAQRFENVLHFAKAGVGADLTDLLVPLNAFFVGAFRACMSNVHSLQQMTIENVVTGTQVVTDLPATLGAVNGATAPLVLATVLSFRSGQKQRYQNGRMFYSGFPNSWVNGDAYNGPTSGTFDALVIDYAARFTGLTPSSGWNGVIYTKGKAPFGSGGVGWPQAAIDVATIRWNKIFGTQRRRIPGHGS